MDVRGAPTTQPTSPAGSRSELGFALFELLLALAILGLVAGVVLPRAVRGSGPVELRAQAEEVAALLRADRNAALRSGAEIVSRIDIAGREVRAGAGGRRVALLRGVEAELVQSSRELSGGDGGIRFRPDGRSSGGVLYLRRGEAGYSIAVNWLTGSVLVGRDASGRSRAGG